MPTLQEELKTEIDRILEIPDPKNTTKKVILKAEMAIKSNNQERMERYLAELQGVASLSGAVAEEEAPGDDDAASDE